MSLWGWEEWPLRVHWLNWLDLLRRPRGWLRQKCLLCRCLWIMRWILSSPLWQILSLFSLNMDPSAFQPRAFSLLPYLFIYLFCSSSIKKSVHKIHAALGISLFFGFFFFSCFHPELPFSFSSGLIIFSTATNGDSQAKDCYFGWKIHSSSKYVAASRRGTVWSSFQRFWASPALFYSKEMTPMSAWEHNPLLNLSLLLKSRKSVDNARSSWIPIRQFEI